ncbi:MAG TPA: ATP-binding protein, partial [Prolixibacteraceae bacterium]|nr:ATP-binding protein [Prolixibacteraceae bacterium]
NTVNDIVEISKIEAGLVELRYEIIDLNNRIEELIQFFAPEAKGKGLEIIFEKLLPKDASNFIADQNKLDSILTNLIKNAIKYTTDGTISISCQIKEPDIEFCINDSGIGIPKHKQKAIFNRFEQADIDDRRVFEGSGLGLAIAKSYVEMLGGKIWVESEEGKGSTFYFTIPIINEMKE